MHASLASKSGAWSLLLAVAALSQGPVHTVRVHHSPQQIFAWAKDGLQQMGYTIRSADSTAGTLVADRVAMVDPSVGTRYDQLDVAISAPTGDTTQVDVRTSSWTQFLRESRRHRDRAPSAQVEDDAGRLLDVLK
jgi:hypothetical protein